MDRRPICGTRSPCRCSEGFVDFDHCFVPGLPGRSALVGRLRFAREPQWWYCGGRMVQLTDQDCMKLKELGVTALYLFGSRAQGIAGPLSDYDFAVLLEDARAANDPERYPKFYDAVYDICAGALPKDEPPPPGHFTNIDIVFLQRHRTPLHYALSAADQGVLLYDGNPGFRLRFEERARYLYMDFEPFREEAYRLALAMI
ncbi:MAG: nucleotidyltransferase domain-containing protein [Candidatus Uhrbacteria bacterium]